MKVIEGILFDPVGCLAEFPPEPFHEIAIRYFGADPRKKASKSASRSYWHLLNLMQAGGPLELAEPLELSAVDSAVPYEDVKPALAELRQAGVALLMASSLSDAALIRFVEKSSLGGFFTAVWGRDKSCGIKDVPLARALSATSLRPERAAFLSDTAEGLKVAASVGVNSILMMNDPDEARRLAMHSPARGPAGGIVSFLELPDLVRFVAAQHRANA